MYLAPSVPKSSSPSENNMPKRDPGQVGEREEKKKNMVVKLLRECGNTGVRRWICDLRARLMTRDDRGHALNTALQAEKLLR